jgi:hypothetical protein
VVVVAVQIFRVASAIGGVVFTLLAVGFLVGWPWVEALWPFILDETRLGQIFLASIALAIGLPAFWIAASGSVRSAFAGTIDLVVMVALMTAYLLSRSGDRPELRTYALGTAVAGLVLLAAALFARSQPWVDDQAMPTVVRIAFVVFIVALVAVATQLIRAAPTIFPWPLAPESSAMYGFIFLGAAVYFLVGAIEGRSGAATGQMIGFLAYDAVLIGPFISRFSTVPPAHRPSLVVYTGVVVVSGLLALWVLLVARETRLVRRRATA